MWHRPHCKLACPCVSKKPVVLWSNRPADHVVIGWQLAHAEAVDGKPAAMWFGTLPPSVCVLFHADWWHHECKPILRTGRARDSTPSPGPRPPTIQHRCLCYESTIRRCPLRASMASVNLKE
jgi:hypothetical protein